MSNQSRQYGAPVDPKRPKNKRGSSEGSVLYGQTVRDNSEPKTKKEDPSPTTRVVNLFHKNADTDARPESAHHTLGPGNAQASPGDHTHDGGNSKKILDGYALQGSKSNFATVAPSLIAALKRLGMKDETTP